MRNTALVQAASLPAAPSTEDVFSLEGLRVFGAIPPHDHDVVPLKGIAAVYDTRALHFEDIQEGSFYVIERQRTQSCMPWENWLRLEVQENYLRPSHQPRSPLKTSREVVRLERWPRDEQLWAYRYAGGFRDGPMHTWGACHGMVGKVVGVYQP